MSLDSEGGCLEIAGIYGDFPATFPSGAARQVGMPGIAIEWASQP